MGSDDNTHDETTTSDSLASDRRHFLRNAAIAGASGASILTGASAAEAKPRRSRRARRTSVTTSGLEPIATRSVLGYSRIRTANPAAPKATYRTYHRVTSAATSVVLVYGNSANQPLGTNPNAMLPGVEALTVRAALESSSGTLAVAKFGGAGSTAIQPGALVFSDPITFAVAAGQELWIRTEVSSPTGRWPLGISMPAGAIAPYAPVGPPGGPNYVVPAKSLDVPRQAYSETATDFLSPISAPPAVPTGSGLSGYSPVAILGTATTPGYKSTLLVGDSILNGKGEGDAASSPTPPPPPSPLAIGDVGFGARAFSLDSSPLGYLRATMPGDTAKLAASGMEHLASFRLFTNVGNALVNYGRNDITTLVGIELSQPPGIPRRLPVEIADEIAGDLMKLWSMMRSAGLRVFQTTITPRASDVALHRDVRNVLNQWLRDGAPYDPRGVGERFLDPALISSYAQRVVSRDPASPHPLHAVIDVAAPFEPQGPVDPWPTFTGDGTHPTSAGHHAMAVRVQPAFGMFV